MRTLTNRESDEAYQKMTYGVPVGFVTKQEASFRFGFFGDAKDIPKRLRQGRPLPKGFRPAVRVLSDGAIRPAKYGEKYHAEIVQRIGEDGEEGYIYDLL